MTRRGGDGSDAALAVATARDYLDHVVRWLAGRTAYGVPLRDNHVLRQRLATAFVALRSADALVSGPGRDGHRDPAAIAAALDCVRRCEAVHAGAGVFDPRPATVRTLFLRCRRDGEPAPDLGGLRLRRPALTGRIEAAVAAGGDAPTRTPTEAARTLIASLGQVCPVASSSLLDELVIAEVLALALPAGTVARVITHRHVARDYLSGGHPSIPVDSGQCLAAIAVTEPHCGSDLSGLRTAVRLAGAQTVLDGRKALVAGGADGDVLVVAAKAEGSTVLALVDANRPEVERRLLNARAWRSVGFADITFHDYPLTDRDLLPGDGTADLLAGLVRERMILAAQQLATARRWLVDLDGTARAGLALRVTAAQALFDSALAAGTGDSVNMADGSMAKVACCAVAVRVAEARTAALAPDACDRRIEELLDDEASARACTIAGGTADVNLAVVEGSLLALTGGRP